MRDALIPPAEGEQALQTVLAWRGNQDAPRAELPGRCARFRFKGLVPTRALAIVGLSDLSDEMTRQFFCAVIVASLLLPHGPLWAAGHETRAKPRRIVSINLCADQYLMALADPEQIGALTQFARDRTMSAGAAEADHLPISRGSAEDVLILDPDLLISSPSRRAGTRATLKGRYPTLELPPAKSYADIVSQMREVAAAIGQTKRGEALIRNMDASLGKIPMKRQPGVAAYYQRRGYLTGAGTLVDELMARVGLVNLATKLGKSALSRISLEDMTAAQPDYIIVEDTTERVTDLGTEMLHHPALDGIKRLHLPQAWTVCGGPAYVLAAQSLAQQLSKP